MDDLDIITSGKSEVPNENEDTLIFPYNVHESLAAAGKMSQSEKAGLLMSFWLFGNGILAWVLAGWLRQITPEYYVWLVLGIELLLQLTIGAFLLRFLLDEQTLIAEMGGGDNTFSKFFSIYHEIVSTEGSTYPFDVIEFSDGSYGVYLQFLLGYNTNQQSHATYNANHTIQTLINKSGMAHRIFYMNENFSHSESAEWLRNTVAQVEDPKLFKGYREIVKGMLELAEDESNVVSATYIIYAKNRIEKEELPHLVNNIMLAVQAEETAYREVSVLSYDDIIEFYRSYYKLDVLDMGIVRVHAAQKKQVNCSVKLLRVYGKSGKVYTTSEFPKLRDNLMRDYGLQQINKDKVKEAAK